MTGRRLTLLIACALSAGLAWAAPPKIAAVKATPRAVLKLERDYIAPIASDDAVIKTGAVVDLVLQSGKRYEGLEISDIQLVKADRAFRTISFQPLKGVPSRLATNSFYQLRTADRVFDVVTDPKAKAWLLLDQTQRDEVAAERLRSRRQHLWDAPTDDAIREVRHFYEDLFEKAQAMFPMQRFARVETKYFVFFTDMPPAQVAGYIANLDTMYDQLCVLFGLPKDTNIWIGKCPVIAFLQRESFSLFEAAHLGVADTQGVAGLNHNWGDGRVLTVCARGDDPVFFAVVLVHETSHGFLHRIRSSERIPPWMNEGIADWIAAVVVPQSDHINRRMTEAVPRLRATGSLGGDFLDDEGSIDRWQYGVAATLTQLMMSTDANAYRALITGIKEGYTWQEALELTYGLTSAELAAAYGRQLGIPQLRP